MSLSVLMALANPMTWLVGIMVFISWVRWRERSRFRERSRGHERDHRGRRAGRRLRVGTSSAAGLGAAFQFLSMAYRPNHAFVAKAQIQQEEDADEDDDGSPETPVKHLNRQLRRIRRGEPVDHLIWRLE
jgi:hypothetical protein